MGKERMSRAYTLIFDGPTKRQFFVQSGPCLRALVRVAIRRLRRGSSGQARILAEPHEDYGGRMGGWVWQRGRL